MSNSLNDSNEISQILAKESLYKIFFKIKSQIQTDTIQMSPSEYETFINTASISQLTDYIFQSINILIDKKINDYLSKQKTQSSPEKSSFNKTAFNFSNLKKNFNLSRNNSTNNTEIFSITHNYEQLLKYLENSNRQLYRQYFKLQLSNNNLENKMYEYLSMEEEFEEMKAKYKYDNGKFLNNDRKDNEIIIIRTENTNLKQTIKNLEDELKKCQILIKDKEESLSKLKKKMEELTDKKENNKDSETCSNNINTCCSNNLKNSFNKEIRTNFNPIIKKNIKTKRNEHRFNRISLKFNYNRGSSNENYRKNTIIKSKSNSVEIYSKQSNDSMKRQISGLVFSKPINIKTKYQQFVGFPMMAKGSRNVNDKTWNKSEYEDKNKRNSKFLHSSFNPQF